MEEQRGALKLKDVRRRFDRAAGDFDAADFVHRACCEGLIDRLQILSGREWFSRAMLADLIAVWRSRRESPCYPVA